MDKDKKFYTIQEAAEIMGISEEEILKMIESKRMPALKIGRAIRISEKNIEDFLDGFKSYKDLEVDADEFIEPVISSENIMGNDEVHKKKKIMELEKELDDLNNSCKNLLKRKKQLEEDLQYIKYEYDEFKHKVKKSILNELKAFLHKIEKEEMEESFEDDMVEIDNNNGQISNLEREKIRILHSQDKEKN